MASGSVPPAILKILSKRVRGKKLTQAESARLAKYEKNQQSGGKSKATTSKNAIGVPGKKIYDQSGKFIGYSKDTYVTPKKHNPEQQSQLDAATQYMTQGQIDKASIQRPRYYDGDEYRPAADLNVEQRISLQNQMEASGLYAEGADVIQGVWGIDDVNAYAKALASANAAGVTVEEWLANSENIGVTSDDELEERDPLVIKLTNPDDIRAVIQSGSKAMHGVYLAEDEIQRFISGYQNEERRVQTLNYDAEPYGGEVIQEPNQAGLQDQAEQAARTGIHENEFKQKTFTDRIDEVLEGLRGSTASNPTQVGPM